MYLLSLFDMIGKDPNKSEYIFPSFVTLGSMVAPNARLVFLLSPRSIFGVVLLVHCSYCLFMCGWFILLLMYLSKCLLVKLSFRTGDFSRKYLLVSLRRFIFVGTNSAA